jgi:hypothetical protein
MKTTTISRTLVAIVIAFGVQTTANAQLGGLLNKAKSAVKSKAKDAIDNAKDDAKKKADKEKDKVQTAVAEKQISATLGTAPECPWVLAKGVKESDIEQLVQQLGKMDHEKTKAFAEQINARAEYNQKILSQMKTGGPIPFDATIYSTATVEKQNWEKLYGKILNRGDVYGPGNLMKTEQGWGTDTKIQIIIDTKNGIFVTAKDNKGMFCSLGGDGIYVDEDNMPLAKEAFTFNLNAAALLEGFAQHQDNALERSYNRALMAAKFIGEAISNNSPDNLEKRARPKAGSMNGAWRAKALALAKQKFSNAVDVIVVSDGWDVKTNALGVPVNRIIYGYVLTNDKAGTRAMRVSWDQKHQGGGKYGALNNYGVAAESPFYVK